MEHFIEILKNRLASKNLESIIFADDLVLIYHKEENEKVLDTIDVLEQEY